MRVCLVRPPAVTNTGLKGQIAAPPLGLAYIAGALRQAGHEVVVVDAVGAAPDRYRPIAGVRNAVCQGLDHEDVAGRVPSRVDLVGVHCMFSVEWPYDLQTIRAIRRHHPGVPIVVGGEHVTACPEYIMETCHEVDFAVVGEGEETVVELCEALEQGRGLLRVAGLCVRDGDRVVKAPRRGRIRDVDNIAAPDWSLFDIPAYIDNGLTWGVDLGVSMPILASRGCPYRCAFCSSANMWTSYWRPRHPLQVIDEMKRYMREYGATSFDFYDLSPVVSRRWIVSFTKALIEEDLGIRWQMSSGTRSEAIDDETAALLYRSGCRNLNLAPESGSAALLERMHKRVDLERLLAAIRSATRTGLRVKTNIIFGFPDETLAEAMRTYRLAVRLAAAGAHDMGAFFYVLIPGSEIFETLRQAGKVEIGEAHFERLLAFTDSANRISFAENFSSRQIAMLTMGSMLLFYSVSYLTHPARFLELLDGLRQHRSQSKLGKQILHAKRKQDAILAVRKARGARRLLLEARSWSGVFRGRHAEAIPGREPPAPTVASNSESDHSVAKPLRRDRRQAPLWSPIAS